MSTAVELNETAVANMAAETALTNAETETATNIVHPQELPAHGATITSQVTINESFCPQEYAWLQVSMSSPTHSGPY